MKLITPGRLMALDVVLAAEERNPAQVAASLRAGINLARSVGDEPALLGQLIAVACMVQSVEALERALAQLELPAAELTAIQELLEREIDEPRMVWALRGERAGQLHFLQGFESGRIKHPALPRSRGKYAWLPDWFPWAEPVDRIGLMRGMNELVEAAKLPVKQQLDEIERLQRDEQNRHLWSTANSFGTNVAGQIGDRMRLPCAVVALAAERYRQRCDIWPASLDALVKAGLLKTVPLDPFDGKALRFRHVDDGVVIYSVGRDRVDSGGSIDRKKAKTPTGDDIGFRLWDKGARGKLPPRPGHDGN